MKKTPSEDWYIYKVVIWRRSTQEVVWLLLRLLKSWCYKPEPRRDVGLNTVRQKSVTQIEMSRKGQQMFMF